MCETGHPNFQSPAIANGTRVTIRLGFAINNIRNMRPISHFHRITDLADPARNRQPSRTFAFSDALAPRLLFASTWNRIVNNLSHKLPCHNGLKIL
jgi:hypothetical protein